jgi:hypothetical protein
VVSVVHADVDPEKVGNDWHQGLGRADGWVNSNEQRWVLKHAACRPRAQAIKFEVCIALRTAKVLGLTIPQSLVLRADEVIQ